MTVPPNSPGDRPRRPDTPETSDQPPATIEQIPNDQHPGGVPPAAPPEAAPTRPYVAGVATAGIASVCGAVFTSWAGVQGTLVGALVGATIGSSVSEIVRTPLTSVEQRIIRAGVSARQLRRDGLVKTILSSPVAAKQALGMISGRALVTVAAVALIGFAVAMSGLTAVEASAGEPISAIVADSSRTGTTIGNVLPNPPAALAPDPAPSAGRENDGQAGARPADPVLGAEDPAAASPTPAAAATSGTESASGVAPPVPGAAPGAPEPTAGATTGTQTPPGSATDTAIATPSAVQVVTVVVTATPTQSATTSNGAVIPTVRASSAPAPVQDTRSTPTSTPTPTPTPTPPPGSATP